MQRNRAMPRSAEGPRDPVWCRETARSYGVQRDRVLDRRRGEPDAPCPSRRTLDAGEPTPNTLSVIAIKNNFLRLKSSSIALYKCMQCTDHWALNKDDYDDDDDDDDDDEINITLPQ